MVKMVSGLYQQGRNIETREVTAEPEVFDAKSARQRIKTRSRKFVEYLKSQFADRFEFFIEARSEGHDVVHIGDKTQFKNFELEIDYTMGRVVRHLKKGVQVFHNMMAVEAWLGKVRRVMAPDWTKQKHLKIKKQLEKLMRKSRSKERRVKPESASSIMIFTF
jgi:hypothetical protein